METEGESSLRGHIKGQSETDEGSGSVAYVPPEPKDDLQLNYALDLLRGAKTDPAFPPNPEKAELQVILICHRAGALIPPLAFGCFPVLGRARTLGTDLHAPLGQNRKAGPKRPGVLRFGRIAAASA